MGSVMAPEPLSPDEARRVDAQYSPFPAFRAWANTRVHSDLWDRFAARLDTEREASKPESLERALRVVMRTAAIDTGAIEGLYKVDRGFTQTVAIEAAAWQTKVREHGTDVEAFFEAQLRTYELVLDAATHTYELNEAWIRRIHEEVCAPQETYGVQTPTGPQQHPLPKGAYKSSPNHVTLPHGGVHAYSPVDQTAPEMARLVQELKSPAFLEAHPISQAAYSHFALVAIHPFADGNGRVARALASLYFYRAESVPLVVFADQTLPYLEALEAADGGEYQPFVDFVENRGLDTLSLVTESLREARAPLIEESLGGLAATVESHGGMTHKEVDEVAHRLSNAVLSTIKTEVVNHPLPQGVAVTAHQVQGMIGPGRDGYRDILVHPTFVQVEFQSQKPATASLQVQIKTHISLTSSDPFPLVVERLDTRETVEFRLSDVRPEQTATVGARLASFSRALIAEGLDILRRAADESLRNAGFK